MSYSINSSVVFKKHKEGSLEDRMMKALDGDKVAYASFLREISKIVRSYLYRKISMEEDLEDVVQEVLVSVDKAKRTYDGQRPIKPWVMAIATYRLNDYLRKRYRQMAREGVDYDSVASQLAEPVTEVTHDSELLNMAVNSLPEKQRKIVTLMKIEGYSAKEVAKIMDMSVSAVKVAAHRSYKKLKEYLEDAERQES